MQRPWSGKVGRSGSWPRPKDEVDTVVTALPGILDIGQIECVLQHPGVYAWGPEYTEYIHDQVVQNPTITFTKLLENAVQEKLLIRAIKCENCGYIASATSWVERLGIPDIDPPFESENFD
jgi:hypothetical protein